MLVEVVVFGVDKDGKAIFKKSAQPVRFSIIGTLGSVRQVNYETDQNEALPVGMIRKFRIPLTDVPPQWSGRVEAYVTRVQVNGE